MLNPMVGEVEGQTPPPQKNNNVKWIAAGIVVGLGFFGYIVQSGNNSAPIADTVVNTTPAPQPEPEVSYEDIAEEVFVDAVKSEVSYMRNASDADILDLGYQVCDIFASGVTVDEYVYLVLEEFPYDEDAQQLAAVIAGAAVATLCPEHSWMMN